MPVSPSGVSWISAGHFRTCWSLDGIELSKFGWKPLNTDGQKDLKPRKLPRRCRHAHSFESFLGILPLNTSFFLHHLVPHVCPSIWRIDSENSRASLWNQRYSEEGDLPGHFASTFFSCYAIFTWIWTCKTHDLPNYQFTIGSFLQAITFMWSYDKSQGDLNSSNSKYFPLFPQWSISNVLLFFEVSISIFCVLIRQCQSLHFVCFRIFAAPVVWSILGIAVLALPG